MDVSPILTSVGILLAVIFLGGCHHATDFKEFDVRSVTRSGSFSLDMTPAEALPLFTAPGERLWAPGWDPAILKGDGYEKGTVFVTASHGHTGYWHVVEYDKETHHAQYIRVIPGATTGTIDVRLSPNDEGGSTVHVTYQLTALSEAGNKHLEEEFNEAHYAEMMEQWRSLITTNQDKIDQHFSH